MPSVSVLPPFPEEGANDKETIRNLLDTVIKLRKELEFLLGNLDEDNVIRAKTALILDPGAFISWGQIDGEKPVQDADNTWQSIGADRLTYIDQEGIYTGTITAQQINVIQGIELGDNAIINWGELPTLPTAAQIGARANSWMPSAYDVGALPWDTYIPVLPSYIKETYIDQTNVISPFISGGVITGTLFRTAVSGARLEVDSSGIISYNADDYQDGITIERGTFSYSALDFYHLGVKVGTLEYDGLGTFSLSPQGDAVLLIHNAEAQGSWNFTNAEVSGLDSQIAVFA